MQSWPLIILALVCSWMFWACYQVRHHMKYDSYATKHMWKINTVLWILGIIVVGMSFILVTRHVRIVL